MERLTRILEKRWVLILLVVLILLPIATCGINSFFGRQEKDLAIMEALGRGINLGNDLDVVAREYRDRLITPEDFETYWHNKPVTQKWFAGVRKAGFRSVRIPVSWGEHLDASGKIDPAWMARVKEIVDWAIAEGLCVVLNTHHEDWLVPTRKMESQVTEQLVSVWSQIAETFRDYDKHLLFEGMNEPRLRDTDLEWTGGDEESRGVVNRLNAVFVETIRNAGGKNKDRYLLVTPYASSCRQEVLESFVVPDDRKVIVSVHAYLPREFVSDKKGKVSWSKHDEDSVEDILEFRENIQTLFLDKNIPVAVTEYGCVEKKHSSKRESWAKYYVKAFSDPDIPLFWWDNGEEYCVIARKDGKVTDKDLVKIITKRTYSRG